jgi:hypothetical protein
MLEGAPGYWRHEISGVVARAVIAYFHDCMRPEDVAAMRAYLRQWIGAPMWDRNPYADEAERAWLAEMRSRVDALTSRAAIERWLADAIEGGIDPL